MNNLFYSLEDGKYYTYPDGDEATGIQIREVIEANERSISKLQQETEKLKKQLEESKDNYNCLLKQKEIINKAIEYIQGHQLVFRDHTTEEIDEWFNQFYIDVLDILKEVE